MKTFEDILK